MLSQVKLIAEPWDLGEGGYQVGNFPVLWTEWNGKYRDSVRRFWKGDGGVVSEFATRCAAAATSTSGAAAGRTPASTSSPATTASRSHDLVSYNEKHNEANGEDNRDGDNDNLSWNCGAEGPDRRPGDPRAPRATEAQLPGHAAALARACRCSCAGDEIRPHAAAATTTPTARTTRSPGSHWTARRPGQRHFLEFTRRLIALRQRHPVLHRRRFFQGRRIRGAGDEGHRVVRARRPGNDRRGVGRPEREVLRRAPGGRRHRRARRARRAHRRRHAARAAQRPSRAGPLHPPATSPDAWWVTLLDTARPDQEGRRLLGGDHYTLEDRSPRGRCASGWPRPVPQNHGHEH